MDLSAYRLRERTTIASSPDEIYDLLADVSAMGRWSPVCTGGEYDRDDPSWFTGDNAIGDFTWQTRCLVVVAERGREFAFVNHGIDGQQPLVRWGFTLQRDESGGTEVTQSWEVLPSYADGFAAEGDAAGDLAAAPRRHEGDGGDRDAGDVGQPQGGSRTSTTHVNRARRCSTGRAIAADRGP